MKLLNFLFVTLTTVFIANSLQSQCIEITCPSDININNDNGQCGAVVTFSAPQGVDPCALGNVTFTNCGATGRFGPSQVQVNTAYSGGPLDGQVTINTQGVQEWTVPTTGTYTIEVAGAKGGNGSTTYLGGLGSIMRGDLTLTAGDVLTIIVGQVGQNNNYAGGGGGSAVSLNNNPLIVAGGGGGGNNVTNQNTGYDAVTGPNGISSYTTGGTGGNGASGGFAQGGAGYFSNGQNIGLSGVTVPQSFQNGAVGGDGYTSSYWGGFGGGGSGFGGGGGGGGYSGGSGGHYNCCTSFEASGGGGGSFNAGTNQSNTAGANAGNGYVNITWSVAPATTTQIAGLASGSLFPIGVTTQTYEAVNGFGNTATCSFTIEVVDNENPTITPPSAINVSADASSCGATGIVLGSPVTADNCSINTVFNNAPAIFPTGTTSVTWTVTDNAGNSSFATQTVTVTDSENPTITPPSAINVSTDASSCEATNVALGSPITADNCAVNSVINDSPASFPIGTTTVTWTVTDDAGNSVTETQTVTVTDNEDPFVADCPADILINANSSGCEAIVSWVIPIAIDNCTANLIETISHNPGDAFALGTTNVSYQYQDDAGNTSTCAFSIEVVNDLDVLLNGTDIICYGDQSGQVTSTPSGGSGVLVYDWTDGSGFSSSDQNLTGVTAGTYDLTITDENGCSITEQIIISQPDSIELVAAVVDLLCFGDENGAIDLTANGGSGDLTFEWNGPNSFNSTDQNITDLESGSYSVEAEDENGCVNTLEVNVNAPSDLDATATSTEITSGNDGTIDLTVTGGTPNYTYVWDGPNGFTSTDQNLTDLAAPGLYTVTITDDNGCEFILEMFVDSSVGLDQININLVNVYPNPNNGAFTVDFGGVKELVSIQVIDAQGRIVKQQTFNNTNKAEMNLEAQKGVYSIRFNLDGLLVIKKIALQ